MHPELQSAAQQLSVSLPALKESANFCERTICDFKQLLKEIGGDIHGTDKDKISVVLLGSLARREASPGSDCDYFVLQDGASPRTTQGLTSRVEKIRDQLGFRTPGVQGMFGNVVIAANLYESIGLDIDSNTNMTRRILLLTESESIFSESTHERVIENILQRYCDDYLPPNIPKDSPAKVPRYLLNDLIRYWRTMAVDFGTKRWRAGRDDSYLRLAKLRVSRKILFAGPLATLLLVPRRILASGELPKYLKEWLSKPPITQLASCVELLCEESQDALRQILVGYDEFIGLLASNDREVLQTPKKNRELFEELEKKCKRIANMVQSGLETIFWDDDLFSNTFRKYAVF